MVKSPIFRVRQPGEYEGGVTVHRRESVTPRPRIYAVVVSSNSVYLQRFLAFYEQPEVLAHASQIKQLPEGRILIPQSMHSGASAVFPVINSINSALE